MSTLLALAFLSTAAVSFASPDFNNPAQVTGVLQVFDGDDFYINNFELEDLNRSQKDQLRSLVGQEITVKGFYEKVHNNQTIDEISVTDIIVK